MGCGTSIPSPSATTGSYEADKGGIAKMEYPQNKRDSSVKEDEYRPSTAVEGMEYTTATVPSITLDNMNPAIKNMEYAVRGPLVMRATAIEKELEKVMEKEFRTAYLSQILSSTKASYHQIN